MTSARFIAIGNAKGGVGKTTTVVTLGHLLAIQGRRVLIVDCDAQGHVAYAPGIDRAPGLFSLLVAGASLDTVIVPSSRTRLDIIPGDETTMQVKDNLAGRHYRETILDRAMRPAAERYDFVFFDASPSMDVLTVNVIRAAREYIVPVAVDTLPLLGLADYLRAVGEHCEMAGRAARITAIIPTLFDEISRESRDNLKKLQERFADRVTPPVPRDVRAREAPKYGRTLFEYASASRALAAYVAVMEHVLASHPPGQE